MKRTKQSKGITAKEFDEKFDNGEDVTEYLDMSSLRKPGLEQMPDLEQITKEEKSVKITLAISELSQDFFKEQADKTHTSYQKLIRRVLDAYVRKSKGKVA